MINGKMKRYEPKYRAGYTNRRAGWWVWDSYDDRFVENSGHPGRWGSLHAGSLADTLNKEGGYGNYRSLEQSVSNAVKAYRVRVTAAVVTFATNSHDAKNRAEKLLLRVRETSENGVAEDSGWVEDAIPNSAVEHYGVEPSEYGFKYDTSADLSVAQEWRETFPFKVVSIEELEGDEDDE